MLNIHCLERSFQQKKIIRYADACIFQYLIGPDSSDPNWNLFYVHVYIVVQTLVVDLSPFKAVCFFTEFQ